MEKRKFYYNQEDGTIEVRPFYDEVQEQNKPYIEITFEEWREKLAGCTYGYKKAYINNEIVEVEDEAVMNSDEYKAMMKAYEIKKLKRYLTETDYVVTKLNELKLVDPENYEIELTKYQDILNKRKEARIKINNEEAF